MVEAASGAQEVLAHVDLPGPPRVGRYGVDLPAFERVALPALRTPRTGGVVVVDELGKMELASPPFREAVDQLLGRDVAVVATVHRWKWKDLRHRFTTPDGRWKPITADGIELFNLESVAVTRYRWRGNAIPNPWTLPATPDGKKPRRARCGESRTPGSASGLGKRTGSNASTAPQADSSVVVVESCSFVLVGGDISAAEAVHLLDAARYAARPKFPPADARLTLMVLLGAGRSRLSNQAVVDM